MFGLAGLLLAVIVLVAAVVTALSGNSTHTQYRRHRSVRAIS